MTNAPVRVATHTTEAFEDNEMITQTRGSTQAAGEGQDLNLEARLRLASEVGRLRAVIEGMVRHLTSEHPDPQRAVDYAADALGGELSGKQATRLTACLVACNAVDTERLTPYALFNTLGRLEDGGAS